MTILDSDADVFFLEGSRYSLPRVRVNQEVVDFVSNISSQDFHRAFVTSIKITWCFSYENAVDATFLFIIIITAMSSHLFMSQGNGNFSWEWLRMYDRPM